MLVTASIALAVLVATFVAGHVLGHRVLEPLWVRLAPGTWAGLERPERCPCCPMVHVPFRVGGFVHRIVLTPDVAHAFARDLLELVLRRPPDDELPFNDPRTRPS